MGEREGDERSGGGEGGEGGRELGYFVCQQPVCERGEGGETGEVSHNALCYAWDASTFPWLMTWEENYGRDAAPWSTSKKGRERDRENKTRWEERYIGMNGEREGRYTRDVVNRRQKQELNVITLCAC